MAKAEVEMQMLGPDGARKGSQKSDFDAAQPLLRKRYGGRKGRRALRMEQLMHTQQEQMKDPVFKETSQNRRIGIAVGVLLCAMVFMITLYSIECPRKEEDRRCKGSAKGLDCGSSTHVFFRECWKSENNCWVDTTTKCADTECMAHSLSCPTHRVCVTSQVYGKCVDPPLVAFQNISIGLFLLAFLNLVWQVIKWRLVREDKAKIEPESEDDEE